MNDRRRALIASRAHVDSDRKNALVDGSLSRHDRSASCQCGQRLVAITRQSSLWRFSRTHTVVPACRRVINWAAYATSGPGAAVQATSGDPHLAPQVPFGLKLLRVGRRSDRTSPVPTPIMWLRVSSYFYLLFAANTGQLV
jgi:hypothetical protein